jgi:hypothetical protein
MGKKINQLFLFDDYQARMIGMDASFFKEFAKCDINDLLAAYHDNPVTLKEYRKWFMNLNLQDIYVEYGYNGIEGRGRKAADKV